MTDLERIEIEVDVADGIISRLEELLEEAHKERDQLQGKLNRARRLEREELQNGKTSGD